MSWLFSNSSLICLGSYSYGNGILKNSACSSEPVNFSKSMASKSLSSKLCSHRQVSFFSVVSLNRKGDVKKHQTTHGFNISLFAKTQFCSLSSEIYPGFRVFWPCLQSTLLAWKRYNIGVFPIFLTKSCVRGCSLLWYCDKINAFFIM